MLLGILLNKVFRGDIFSFFLGKYLGMELLGCREIQLSVFSLVRNDQPVSQTGWTTSHLFSRTRVVVISHFGQHLVFWVFLILTILVCVMVILFYVSMMIRSSTRLFFHAPIHYCLWFLWSIVQFSYPCFAFIIEL
jgi:hypothetical protein